MEAARETLRLICLIAALIVTALFPGIYSSYEQPSELGFRELGYAGPTAERSLLLRMYLRGWLCFSCGNGCWSYCCSSGSTSCQC